MDDEAKRIKEEIERMKRDLGLERRDAVSAPNADSRGQLLSNSTSGQQTAVKDAEAQRRDYIIAGNAREQDDRSKRLIAWNTQANFQDTGAVDNLEVRYGGQGHRASLRTHQLVSNDPWEEIYAIVGEERGNYMRANGVDPKAWLEKHKLAGKLGTFHHRNSPAPPKQISSSSRRSGMPIAQSRGRSTVPNSFNRERPKSPRSYGTIRVVPGKRGLGPAVSTPHSVSQSASMGVSAVSAQEGKSSASDQRYKSDVAQVGTTPKPGIIQQSPTENEDLLLATNALLRKKKAFWLAAQPNGNSDEYYKSYPDELHLHETARDELIEETIYLVRDDVDKNKAEEYVAKHPERRWLVGAAKQMRDLVKKGSDEEIETYCEQNPDYRMFLAPAKALFVRATSKGIPPSPDAPFSPSATSSTKNVGSLITNFFNAVGEFLGTHHLPICAPMDAELNITSRANSYDPLQLIDDIESIAQMMSEKSYKSSNLAALVRQTQMAEEVLREDGNEG